MLSKYVIETQVDNEKVLYHTVTKEYIGPTNNVDILESNLFLSTQDRDSINYAMHKNYGVLGLTIIPSWECNLRCKHCSVLTMLRESQEDQIDIDKLINFTHSYIRIYKPKCITLDFIGGEPLLRKEICLEILKEFRKLEEITGVLIWSDITTNATVDFDETCYELFENLNEINISIDGNEDQHNSQRIPFKSRFNPFEKTILNLERLVERGWSDKIKIKVALKDEFITRENYKEFLMMMANIGIDIDRVQYGCLHPTDHSKDKSLNGFKNAFCSKPVVLPCCKYRASSVYLIEANGDVFDLPFKWARSKLGTLDDNIEIINENRIKIIDESFVCFKDEKCMSCPVLGYCWGGCVTANPLHEGKPSDYCDQKGLIETVTELAKNGELVQSTDKKFPLTILRNREKVCQTNN